MKQAMLHIGTERLRQSSNGLVYGGLHIQLDEQRFPHLAWTDPVVVTLAWWCRALARVLQGEREPVEVRFFEGPYLAIVGPMNGNALHLELVEDGQGRHVLREADVLTDPLVGSVVDAAALAIAESRKRHWWSKDADELVDALAALRRAGLRSIS